MRRIVRAEVVTRYVFNYRLRPATRRRCCRCPGWSRPSSTGRRSSPSARTSSGGSPSGGFPHVLEYDRGGAAPFRAVLGSQDRGFVRSSRVFTDHRDFGCFMSSSTTSLAPSRRDGELVRIDLDARGTRWEELPVVDVADDLVPSGATFESAFVGHGGSYAWWLAEESRLDLAREAPVACVGVGS